MRRGNGGVVEFRKPGRYHLEGNIYFVLCVAALFPGSTFRIRHKILDLDVHIRIFASASGAFCLAAALFHHPGIDNYKADRSTSFT